MISIQIPDNLVLLWEHKSGDVQHANRSRCEQQSVQKPQRSLFALEVSLDSRVREVINRNMLEPTSRTFDDAQQQIYTLMQRDSYPRFINSSAYTDLLKSLEEPPPEP
uniref:Regulator of G-protein signaling 20 n=1 Tax=Nothobranchius furzeri TaxID=105023 RepID=A0A1A8APK5_NOTFU